MFKLYLNDFGENISGNLQEFKIYTINKTKNNNKQGFIFFLNVVFLIYEMRLLNNETFSFNIFQ